MSFFTIRVRGTNRLSTAGQPHEAVAARALAVDSIAAFES